MLKTNATPVIHPITMHTMKPRESYLLGFL